MGFLSDFEIVIAWTSASKVCLIPKLPPIDVILIFILSEEKPVNSLTDVFPEEPVMAILFEFIDFLKL